jgi:hypothetical protein
LPLDEAASLQAFVERINEVFTPNACARVELAATYAQMGKLEEAMVCAKQGCPSSSAVVHHSEIYPLMSFRVICGNRA